MGEMRQLRQIKEEQGRFQKKKTRTLTVQWLESHTANEGNFPKFILNW